MMQSEEPARDDELDMLLDELRHGRTSEEHFRELMEKLDGRNARDRGYSAGAAKRPSRTKRW